MLNFNKPVASLAVLAVAALGPSQSFNVDVDLFNSPPEVGGGAPSSSFGGAAGQVGFWNAYPDNVSQSFPLQDIAGASTGVTITATGLGGSGGWNNPVNTGDFNLLLNDAQQVGNNFSYTLSGLNPGPYLLYTYAVKPNSQFGEAFTTVSGSITSNPQRAAGTMPGNQFVLGVTHTVHEVDVTAGILRLQVEGPWPNAYVNGFQIVAVPEPATFAPLLFAGLFLVRRTSSC
jgi:hypothetical protein